MSTNLCDHIVKHLSHTLNETHLWAEVEGLKDEATVWLWDTVTMTTSGRGTSNTDTISLDI